MKQFHPKHQAVIVMDDTNRALNRAVALKHAWFQRQGNRNLWFDHIVEYPFFTDSQLSAGVQLADLCGYNIYRAFRYEKFDYPYFKKMLPYFYIQRDGKKLDGLKVFPNDSTLVAFARRGWDLYQKENPAKSGASKARK
jgi:hypothetical protein